MGLEVNKYNGLVDEIKNKIWHMLFIIYLILFIF